MVPKSSSSQTTRGGYCIDSKDKNNSIIVETAFKRSLMLLSRVEILVISSRKHAYIILTPPHKPHFYIVKLGFTGVYIIFSYFA